MLIAMRIRNMPTPATISNIIVPITISIMLIDSFSSLNSPLAASSTSQVAYLCAHGRQAFLYGETAPRLPGHTHKLAVEVIDLLGFQAGTAVHLGPVSEFER
jgi:hypothetical protein